jgi:hypothetical protein
MQEINAQVRNTVRSSLLPFLNANAPIRNIEAKAKLLRELGYTKEQFGFSDSGMSKIEILIGNEFFRLKKMGQVEQDGWIWKVVANPSAQAVQPTQEAVQPIEQEDQTTQEEVQPIEEIQMVVAGNDQEPVVNEEPIEDRLQVVNIDDLINPAISNRLLACDGYRNSLIESTACYGNFDKSQCNGCLLAFWCSPFTAQLKAEKKADRQAKRQAKSAKEALLEKYADKKDSLTSLLGYIGNAVEIVNTSDATTYCMFSFNIEIPKNEKCVFVKNFGVISMSIYNEIKESGLV